MHIHSVGRGDESITLEGEPKVDEEGVFQRSEYLYLSEDVPQGLSLHTLPLVHVLHGEHALAVLLLHDAYLQQSAVTMVTDVNTHKQTGT
jgi:hypothetical protein